VTGADIHVCTGDELLAYAAALHSVHIGAFRSPPWNEDEEKAAKFLGRLVSDVRRPGFTAAIALQDADVVGFTAAWTTHAR
jgi:hypothetical protein